MILALTPDIEQALAEQAQQQGTTPEQLALDSLRQQFVRSTPMERVPAQPGTLAELLGDSIGVLGSREHVPGGAQLSEASGKAFTSILEEKRRRGHL